MERDYPGFASNTDDWILLQNTMYNENDLTLWENVRKESYKASLGYGWTGTWEDTVFS